ncbi:carboxymuconolactone decarboxylase family protein [Parasphingorhabdus sp.]|uniref:carboxymuconolactone decarboxylase family protein n=1 Tax=Parasphingorhabdus sp. TaxID=2709688 RepID=UPI0032EC585B
MALLPYPDPELLSPENRQIVDAMPLNLVRMLARLGPAFPAFFGLVKSINEIGGLSAQQRELIALRTSHKIGARYVWEQHVNIARQLGIMETEIDAIRKPATEPLGLFVEALLEPTSDPAPHLQSLKKMEGDQAVHEAILVTGIYFFLSRYSDVLQVDMDEGFLDDLQRRLSRS